MGEFCSGKNRLKKSIGKQKILVAKKTSKKTTGKKDPTDTKKDPVMDLPILNPVEPKKKFIQKCYAFGFYMIVVIIVWKFVVYGSEHHFQSPNFCDANLFNAFIATPHEWNVMFCPCLYKI